MTYKKALITGITGQDGSYLAELLLRKNYEVHGIIRRASTFNTQRIDHIYLNPNLKLHYGDLCEQGLLSELIYNIKPDEIYHLAAQSHVRVSFDLPEYTGNITGLGTIRILDAIRRSGIKTKFYQASSSELFGKAVPPQNEKTPFVPQSPYAIAKLYSYWMAVNYREGYNMFVSNGILFNHESPRRGQTFVTRKITRGISRILAGKEDNLSLGNLDSKRDWGFAPEYVKVMWQILQHEKPDDFVIGTGESHSVREFVQNTFLYCGVEIEWIGKGIEERGVVKSFMPIKRLHNLKEGQQVISIDPKYFRPTEVDYLLADTSKANKLLNWNCKVKFNDLINVMMDYDLAECGLDAPNIGKSKMEKEFSWINNNYMQKNE